MRFTKRQKEVLDFITTHLKERGYGPSVREIGAHFGLSSPATVHQHIMSLEKMGALSRDWNRSRSLRPTNMELAAVREVPILGDIAAGYPIPAVETLDDAHTVAVPENFLGLGDHFALRVEGDSMIDEGIHNGDIIIIQHTESAENGQVVVALIDENETTVKKFYRRGNKIVLKPSNPAFENIELPAQKVRVQGIVVSLIRKFA